MGTGFENDVFISYSHIDNQPFYGDPSRGWVDVFHDNLQNFVNVHLGRRAQVWRDKRLTGAEVFSGEIHKQLRDTAVLVSILSPGYMQSEWCNRELIAFAEAAQSGGTLRIGNLQRAIKVLRLPVERRAFPAFLNEVLGTTFYRVDDSSGHARDLLLDPSVDSYKQFLARVDDVAQDISRLLKHMTSETGAAASPQPDSCAGTVFLAWTTSDLSEDRERMRRELEARNYWVLPSGPPPSGAAQIRGSVRATLQEAKVAIHLIGAQYGFVPEGEERSVIELQSDDEIYQSSHSAASRIFWLAPEQPTQDSRLLAFLARMHTEFPRMSSADLLINRTFEELKTLVLDRLNPAPKIVMHPATSASKLVYLMCDHLDHGEVSPVEDYLFDQRLEVRLPLFDGDPKRVREEHFETLKECDGVLIFWGNAKEDWLRSKLRDLRKVLGLGRTDPYKAASIYLAGLPDAEKERFRTREATFIRAERGFEPDLLRPFIAQLCDA